MINKMNLPFSGNARSGRGIALVVVLGMLALLMMIGVAFSVFMRTERQAAGSFQHDVRARQLLFAAQARAIEAIEESFAGWPYPDWNRNMLVSPGSGISITTNEVWSDFVPDALLGNMTTTHAGWISVGNGNVGRVGYLIFNASGLLDANSVGGLTRSRGTDPREIDVAGVSEVLKWTDFQKGRPYESVAEMKRAGTAIGLSAVKNFSDFSLATNEIASGAVDLAGKDTDLEKPERKAEILAKLNANFPDISADMIYQCLLDYVDEDSVPRNLNSPCAERVPMINEIKVTPVLMAVEGDNDNMQLLFQVSVELFYPFVSVKNGQYSIRYKYKVSESTGFPVPPVYEGQIDTPIDFNGERFTEVSITQPKLVLVPCSTLGGRTPSFDVSFDSITVINSDNKTVDSVSNLTLSEMTPNLPTITVPATPPALDPATLLPGGTECLDPRYNYSPYFWLPFMDQQAQGTMGDMNTGALFFLENPGMDNDRHYWMHVADQPLQTPAELSYIIRGSDTDPVSIFTAWQTLRLLDEGTAKADPIYGSFYVSTTNSNQGGYINPNTDVAEVLAAAFRKMPLDRYPGDPDGGLLVDNAMAMTLANAWTNDVSRGDYFSKGDIISNELYRQAVVDLVDRKLPSGYSPAKEFRYEAGFRNLLGLMNARQNYFVAILFAQSSSSVQLPNSTNRIDTVRADQTALLELWRDPVPRVVGTATNYPMLIRRFDILSQE